MPIVSSVRGSFGSQGRFGKGRLGTLGNPASSGIELKNAGFASGNYYIKTSNMPTAVEAYVDNTFSGGGWVLATYGYVHSSSSYPIENRLMPNMNHDSNTFPYNSSSRASSNGILDNPGGQKSTLLLAKSSTECLMAAGNNVNSGGIDSYTHAWKFTIPNPSALTFANHSAYNAAGGGYNGSMTISAVTVTGLKGETGTYSRYVLTEALGSSWSDSYPTGYGPVSDSNPKNGSWNEGPHFPSYHSGSTAGRASYINGLSQSSSPDIGVNGFAAAEKCYTYRGWYTALTVNNTGAMSIWFR